MPRSFPFVVQVGIWKLRLGYLPPRNVARGRLLDTPCFEWLGALQAKQARFTVTLSPPATLQQELDALLGNNAPAVHLPHPA